MPITLMSPDGLPKPEVYRQVAGAEGTRRVHLAARSRGQPMVHRSVLATWQRR